jgi:hypothetical protein
MQSWQGLSVKVVGVCMSWVLSLEAVLPIMGIEHTKILDVDPTYRSWNTGEISSGSLEALPCCGGADVDPGHLYGRLHAEDCLGTSSYDGM